MHENTQSWFGSIPDSWETSTIGSLYSNRNERVSDIDYPPLSVTMRGIVPQLETAAKTDAHEDRKLVRKGDFAINSRSDRRGSCGISDYDGSVSLINTVLTPLKEMNHSYYNWLFHTIQFADEFYRWGHGIVDDLWTTRWQEMKRIEVPIPSLQEQELISNQINSKCIAIDKLITNQENQIERLQQYIHSLISELATNGIDKPVAYKDSGVDWIGTIPSTWSVFRLKYVCHIRDGLVDPKEKQYAKYPHIGPGNIEKFTGRLTSYGLVEDEQLISGKYIFSEKDLVYGKINPQLGKIAFPKFKGLCSADAYAIVCHETVVLPEFLQLWFLSRPFIDRTILESLRMGMPKINRDDLLRIEIAIPPIEEQKHIVRYYHDIGEKVSKLIAIKKNKINKLEEYKRALIFEYVTGKKEVT